MNASAPPQADVDHETAYRRGYSQGYAAAVEAARLGKPIGELAKWHSRLRAWRFKRHGGRVECPPDMPGLIDNGGAT